MNRIEQLIEKYHLHPHPEGGHFAEVYTAPYLYQENRECAGSIYFMLVMIFLIFMSLTVMKSGISMKDVE